MNLKLGYKENKMNLLHIELDEVEHSLEFWKEENLVLAAMYEDNV